VTPSMRCDRDSGLKVASLVSGNDLEMFLWCIKSLFFFSACSCDLWLLDGGLSEKDHHILEEHLPCVRIYREPTLTSCVQPLLSKHPRICELRLQRNFALAKKLIDAPILMKGRKFLLLDSDILFFDNPVELLHRLRDHKGDRF